MWRTCGQINGANFLAWEFLGKSELSTVRRGNLDKGNPIKLFTATEII